MGDYVLTVWPGDRDSELAVPAEWPSGVPVRLRPGIPAVLTVEQAKAALSVGGDALTTSRPVC